MADKRSAEQKADSAKKEFKRAVRVLAKKFPRADTLATGPEYKLLDKSSKLARALLQRLRETHKFLCARVLAKKFSSFCVPAAQLARRCSILRTLLVMHFT